MKKNVKRLLITLSVAAIGTMSIAALAACGNAHKHTYTDWTVDGSNHWRTTVCNDHDVEEEKAAHKYKGDTCTVCGYDKAALAYNVVPDGYSVKATNSGKTKDTLVIPVSMNDLPIIGIDAFGFEGAKASKVILPDTVTSMGREAFSGCNSLKAIDLSGTSLTTVENAAFLNCTSITEVKLPEGLTAIKPGAFEGCAKLEAIELPEGLTELGEQAFGRCSSLKEIELPEGVGVVAHNTFQGCTALSSVTLGSDVDYIGDNAFAHCTSLKTIDLGEKIWYIGQKAFYESGLTQITIPASVSYFSTEAFMNCKSLKTVTFAAESSLVRAYGKQFAGCSALESLTLAFVGSHKNVTTPSEGAFTTAFGFVFGTEAPADAAKYTAVEQNGATYYVPNSLKTVTVLGGTISVGAFDGCSMLDTIRAESGVTVLATSFDGCGAYFAH